MSQSFPELPPLDPSVGDPGHTDDHARLAVALAYVRDNYTPLVVSDTEPPNLPFGHLWAKPRRSAGVPVVLSTEANAAPFGQQSVTLDVPIPAGTTGIAVGSFWTPSAPVGTVTLDGTELVQYGATATSGSTSTDRAVAAFVIPNPPAGSTVQLVQSGSAAIARALIAVCVGGANAEQPFGWLVSDAGQARAAVSLTPEGVPFVSFGIGRGADPMTPTGSATELVQIPSGSSTRIAAAWHTTAAPGGWQLAAADSAAALGFPVLS